MLELGKAARDKVSGFEGIVTGIYQHLYATTQYVVTPKVKNDNQMVDEWFYEDRLELLEKK